MVRSGSAAAGPQAGLGSYSQRKQRCDHWEAEQQKQRNGEKATHGLSVNHNAQNFLQSKTNKAQIGCLPLYALSESH